MVYKALEANTPQIQVFVCFIDQFHFFIETYSYTNTNTDSFNRQKKYTRIDTDGETDVK